MKVCKSLSRLEGREEAWPGHPLILRGIFRHPTLWICPVLSPMKFHSAPGAHHSGLLSAAQELDSSCVCPLPRPPGKESHSVAKIYLKDHFLLKVFLLSYFRVNSSSLISHSTLNTNNIPFFLLYMKQCIFKLYL